MKIWCALVSVLLLFPASGFAAATELPVEIRTAQGVRYYNGGAGLDERRVLPQLYTLKLVFTTDKGLYLSNADVKILDSRGSEVFRVQADNGPWLIADLPPGTYTVEATLEGRSAAVRGIKIQGGSKKTAVLRWKTSGIDMGL